MAASRAAHAPWRLVLMVWMVALLVAAFFFTFLSATDAGDSKGKLNVFEHKMDALWSSHYVELSLVDWTFPIWCVVFLGLLVFLSYIISTTCRKTDEEDVYLYVEPPYLPPTMYIMFILTLAMHILWLFLWDKQHVKASLAVQLLVVLGSCGCLGLSMSSLKEHKLSLLKLGSDREVPWVIITCHNTLSLLVGWSVVWALLNLAVLLTHYTNNNVLSNNQALTSTLILGLFFSIIWAYSLMDLVVFEKSFRYVYSPYVVWAVAFSGMIVNNWSDKAKPNFLLLCILLACTAALLVFKVVRVVHRNPPRLVENII